MVYSLEFFEGEDASIGIFLDLRESYQILKNASLMTCFPYWIFGGG